MHDLDVRRVKRNVRSLEKLEDDGLLDSELAHKLGLIEYCGWIEEKLHCIIWEYVDRKISNIVLRDQIKNSIRSANYGFRYSEFRDKLVAALGEAEVARIESVIRGYKGSYFDLDHFKQVLAELKKKRDECAHTYARVGGTTGFGFSEMEEKLNYVNKGLRIFQSFVRRR